MKNIVISMMMFFGAVASVSAQQKGSVELFIHTSAGSTLENRVGKYNNFYDNANPGDFLWGLAYHTLTGNYANSEPYFSNRVTEMRITNRSNIGFGIRIQPSFLNRIAVGASYHRFTYQVNKKWENGMTTNERETFGTLMGDINATWMRGKNWGLYSGVGLGITKQTYQKPAKETTKSRYDFDPQVNIVGARFQEGVFGAHIELGYGVQGIVNGGLMVRF
jgi:hypothetical protein